jgi:hypothetical protein
MSRMYDKARAAVRQHYIDLMDDKTKKLRSCALFDVNYGPMGVEYYREADEPQGYKDEDGEWVEPMWEDYVKLEDRDIRRAVFGDLIGSGM